MMDGEVERRTRKALELARDGSTTALRLRWERVCPPRKDSAVQFGLPSIRSDRDAAMAAAAVVKAVATGGPTPSEAARVMALAEACRKASETSDLEVRLRALEEAQQ
jgi:hypothetical protein